ncbi:MAG: nitroreductase family protein [Nanoarchaeota archaeon]|nr:nitroreductase family protein [Nanoarchaeota archaeon]
MEVFKAIENRFSCRSYNGKKVSENNLKRILDAGIKAPNAGNLQCWRFFIINTEEKKEGLCKSALNQRWMMQAPVFVVVCGDLTNEKRFYKKKGEDYLMQDCAAAIENMLLSATALGINSCWVGAFDDNAAKRVLKLPDHIIPYAIITLGYSDEKAGKKKRHALDSVVYFNEFDNKEDEKRLFPLVKHFGKK